ncbi:unnamed protein product [Timema podura]|uniref:Uncharacterized protein n=1 Tax=Timema podura TaxID=61482 RepID=A0ABN7NTM9_TIMPD|nr:unnamed protein product [Timema podura]
MFKNVLRPRYSIDRVQYPGLTETIRGNISNTRPSGLKSPSVSSVDLDRDVNNVGFHELNGTLIGQVSTFPCELCGAESLYDWSNGDRVGDNILQVMEGERERRGEDEKRSHGKRRLTGLGGGCGPPHWSPAKRHRAPPNSLSLSLSLSSSYSPLRAARSSPERATSLQTRSASGGITPGRDSGKWESTSSATAWRESEKTQLGLSD